MTERKVESFSTLKTLAEVSFYMLVRTAPHPRHHWTLTAVVRYQNSAFGQG